MSVRELLLNRKNEIAAEIEKLQTETREIDKMLSVTLTVPPAVIQRATPPEPDQRPTTKDEAIIDAIKAGNNTPAKISGYIRQKLGVDVNDASTRTRLSRMKAADKLSHDGFGWKLK
jgi:hypothetical protein